MIVYPLPKYMKIGARGQVTIPKKIREQFGLGPGTEVEFRLVGGSVVLKKCPRKKKSPRKLNLAKWKGRCGNTFAKLGYSFVDKFVDGFDTRSPFTARREADQNSVGLPHRCSCPVTGAH